MDGWLCKDCRSFNTRRAPRCYRCNAPRVLAEQHDDVDVAAVLRALGAPEAAVAKAASDAASPELRAHREAEAVVAAAQQAARPTPEDFRSSRARSRLVIVLVTACVAWAAFSAAVVLVRGGSLGMALDILGGDLAGLEWLLVLSGVGFVLAVLAAISWFAWFDRVHRNVPALTGSWPDTTRAGAVGWWLVPVVGLVRGPRVVGDVYDRLAVPGTPGLWLLACWALSWIAGTVLPSAASRVVSLLPLDVTVTAGLLDAVSLLGQVAYIAAGMFAVAMVLAIEHAQATRSGHDVPAMSDPTPTPAAVHGAAAALAAAANADQMSGQGAIEARLLRVADWTASSRERTRPGPVEEVALEAPAVPTGAPGAEAGTQAEAGTWAEGAAREPVMLHRVARPPVLVGSDTDRPDTTPPGHAQETPGQPPIAGGPPGTPGGAATLAATAPVAPMAEPPQRRAAPRAVPTAPLVAVGLLVAVGAVSGVALGEMPLGRVPGRPGGVLAAGATPSPSVVTPSTRHSIATPGQRPVPTPVPVEDQVAARLTASTFDARFHGRMTMESTLTIKGQPTVRWDVEVARAGNTEWSRSRLTMPATGMRDVRESVLLTRQVWERVGEGSWQRRLRTYADRPTEMLFGLRDPVLLTFTGTVREDGRTLYEYRWPDGGGTLAAVLVQASGGTVEIQRATTTIVSRGDGVPVRAEVVLTGSDEGGRSVRLEMTLRYRDVGGDFVIGPPTEGPAVIG